MNYNEENNGKYKNGHRKTTVSILIQIEKKRHTESDDSNLIIIMCSFNSMNNEKNK